MTEFLKLKKSNCKNCYKCIRHCPVKSIRFSGNQAHVVSDECILCGQCFVICPQNAKEIADGTEKAKVLLAGNEKVIASIAPSFVANYDGIGISSMKTALKKLGFYTAEETAIGATIVKKEYEEIIKDGKSDIIISSCCHSVNLLIQKHYPEALKYLANVMSPMEAHALDIKKRYPDAKVIFIGPCLSKKDEAEKSPELVDCVLTFEELTRWFNEQKIALTPEKDSLENSRARFFPITGGILKTMDCDSDKYDYIAIDGIENCIHVLEDIIRGNASHCFIEMSACVGSCINGPIMEKFHHSPIHDYQQVSSYAGEKDFIVNSLNREEIKKYHIYKGINKKIPNENEIKSILKQMGKTNLEHELNCGTCGYDTCREKAIAVYQGKANLSMCLPFLKEKAESFSDNIISNTTNGIIVLNEDLEVQQINNAACRLMRIANEADVMGEQVIRILDPKIFIDVMETGENICNRRTYLAEYKRYVEQNVFYDKEYHIVICIMRDVTEEEKQKEKKEYISRNTVDIADKVVDKQMRIVQEIASLLGETAAETKIALTKLKESILDE
ncbi:MAG: 4Fe-4S dicluster domain-containing protein [Epulopiscium sp.]|nr:4Fe-4S dicluster domain-containing protein [Candidatus Epulonipiscium sp.]